MRVVIVEDEFLIRMCVRDLLEEAGFECAEAADAAEALALLNDAGWIPDIWVTDYNLGPGMRGDALADKVLRRLPGLPILFITGNPECLDDRAFGPGERLLAKPFSSDDLLRAVHALAAASRMPVTIEDVSGPRIAA